MGKIKVQVSAWANSSQDPVSKIARAKWTGGVAQVVKHLLCKCEVLTSNPSPNPNKQKTLSHFGTSPSIVMAWSGVGVGGQLGFE
jgi:hypothetical protein